MFHFENQFVYPDPKGSELIVPAPFRAGVNRENQFAEWVNKRLLIKNNCLASNLHLFFSFA